MSSNRKPSAKAEAPQEPFKRAVAGCLRAMAGTAEIEVTYAPERPSLIRSAEGAKVRLPEPSRKLDERNLAIVRGHADAMALRMACHSTSIHRRLLPQSQTARACFDAVEQARVEAIGARRMTGVAGNLAAMLDDRLLRARLPDVTQRSEAPLEEALALIVRERLTGAKPPKSGEASWPCGGPGSRNGSAASSIGSARRSTTSAPLPSPSIACWPRWRWVRKAPRMTRMRTTRRRTRAGTTRSTTKSDKATPSARTKDGRAKRPKLLRRRWNKRLWTRPKIGRAHV